MGDVPAPQGDGDNTEYTIQRTPNLETVSKGAQIMYACVWKGASSPPMSWDSDGVARRRDGVRWYLYSDKPPDHFWQTQITQGPIEYSWYRTWDEDVGRYTVIAEIRSTSDSRGTPPTYRYRSQQVGYAGSILGTPLDQLVAKGSGPSPDDALKEIARYRTVLQEIAQRFPPPDAEKHRKTIEKWDELGSRLQGLLASSAGKKRYAMRALHIESSTQLQRPLFLFLVELEDLHQGRYQTTVLKHWALVDWTDPTNPRFRGTYEATGSTVQQAILACLSSWDSGNRYPEGHVTFDIPPELRGIVGGDVRRQMPTDGKNFTDQLIIVFEWIAIGAMTFAGFCFIFVAIPALTSAAVATSMLASTAGAVFSIQQRWRDGIFDWKADALDGLTILSNVAGAGSWVRGARVVALGQAGKTVDFVFIGVRVGSDAVQGVLIVESRMKEVEELLKAESKMPPEERARKLLLVFTELSALGLMTAMSFKAAAKEAEHLNSQPNHLTDDPRTNVAAKRLEEIVDKEKTIDTTKPPVLEGNTKEGKQKSTVAKAAKPTGPVSPDETQFAKKYPEGAQEDSPWEIHKITDNEIHLLDKDGFVFHAECDAGVLEITIITNYDPVKTPYFAENFPGVTEFKKSKVMSAKDLYPLMYKHFEEVGNPVTRLKGLWAWQNAADAKVKYDELIKAKKTSDEAARVAVLYARTFINYHQPMGFGHVVDAKYLPKAGRFGDDLFSFTIDKK